MKNGLDIFSNCQDGQLSYYLPHIYGNQASMTDLPASHSTIG
jgi:hypothetical protein